MVRDLILEVETFLSCTFFEGIIIPKKKKNQIQTNFKKLKKRKMNKYTIN